jgi:hypothetical protein
MGDLVSSFDKKKPDVRNFVTQVLLLIFSTQRADMQTKSITLLMMSDIFENCIRLLPPPSGVGEGKPSPWIVSLFIKN